MKTVVIVSADGDETPITYPATVAGTGDGLASGTDRSGVTLAGAKEVAPANPNRRSMTFQNTSDTDMRLTENGAAATANTGYLIKAGAAVNVSTNRAVSVYCVSAGKTFASTEV